MLSFFGDWRTFTHTGAKPFQTLRLDRMELLCQKCLRSPAIT